MCDHVRITVSKKGVGFAVQVDEVLVPISLRILCEFPTFHADGLVVDFWLGPARREDRFELDIFWVHCNIKRRPLPLVVSCIVGCLDVNLLANYRSGPSSWRVIGCLATFTLWVTDLSS